MTIKYKGTVIEDSDSPGEFLIEFPKEMLDELGWKIGDDVQWTTKEDGSFVINKPAQELSWVLVEAISTYRIRYMVQVPTSNPKWALDTVTMDEAKEFSQSWLGEQIVSHRIVTEEEALKLFDEDVPSYSVWGKDQKQATFFTFWEDIKNG
jgi:bifunctional DNA-binding transcriptional regulator/antitoxin component of YhaV-PrlF toxin-antitoxin module